MRRRFLLSEFGGFLGWLTIIACAGTILNYVLKVVNKKYGKNISSNPDGKKLMSILMKVFVGKHRYWGLAAVLFLLLHFLLQFTQFGLSITGVIAATALILEFVIGMYGVLLHKKRAGTWFWIHRSIAILLVFGIGIHLIFTELM